MCVVHGFVDRHGLEICTGSGFVQDNKVTHFAYYLAFWAWLKEVPAIMLVLWLHSDPLAKRSFFGGRRGGGLDVGARSSGVR